MGGGSVDYDSRGNAGGVMYSYTDSEAAPFGELGMPEEKTFGPKVSMVVE